MLGVKRFCRLVLVLLAAPALAHGNHGAALGWTLDPLLTIPLGLALVIYLVGWRRLSKRASQPPRGAPCFCRDGWCWRWRSPHRYTRRASAASPCT